MASSIWTNAVERMRSVHQPKMTQSEAAYEDVLAHKPGRTFAFVVSAEARRVNQAQFPYGLQPA